MSQINSYRLLTPGPVPLAPEVLKALSLPVFHHRTPQFEAILERVWSGLKKLFRTTQPVMTLTSTGSGAMEAALLNTLSPGENILVVVGGKFGERWAEMSERFGLRVHRLEVPWGEPANPQLLLEKLKSIANCKAVLFQAVDTSTATQNPVRELAHVVHQNSSALVLVDAITGLGAMTLEMDQWGLDVVVAGSQKALMLPTGLSFIALSKRAWAAQKQSKLPKYYFDLSLEAKANLKGQTYFSSANSHLVALDVVLSRFERLGFERIQKRCELLAEATREAGRLLGFSVFSQAPAASVTALRVPAQMDSAKLRDHLEAHYQVTVMGGQDQLQGQILRVGHLGYVTDDDMVVGFQSLAQSLIDLGQTNVDANGARDRVKNILARGPGAD